MNPLQELATQVLLGTERRPPTLATMEGALSSLLAAIHASDSALESQVLRRAGVLVACAEAGYQPARMTGDPLPISEAEQHPAVTDPKWVSALREIFQDGPDSLRVEALDKLAEYGVSLPPRLLPVALSIAHNKPMLQPPLLAVLGQRGRWLARWQADWSYALGGVDAEPDLCIWEHGALEARQTLLKQLRVRDPAAARSLLDQALTELDARERLTLLEPFIIGLSPADEDFLEQRLSDRSKEVRLFVGSLLARLPESRYVTRMSERLSACLKQERKLLRQTWVIEPPGAFNPDWKADAIEENRAKSESLGERAWWLYQIARAVPLAWWSARTELSPAELLKWARKNDWSAALLRGWHDALMREGKPDWAEAFLAEPKLPDMTLDPFALIGHLPPHQQESYWLELLKKARRSGSGEVLAHIARRETPCSAAFARQVLQQIRQVAATDAGRWDYQLRQALPDFLCRIPAALLDEATRDWPLDPGNDLFQRGGGAGRCHRGIA